jgi:hypothetical protein
MDEYEIGTYSTHEAMRNAYKILAGKPVENRAGVVGRIILKRTLKFCDVDWIQLAQDGIQRRDLGNTVLNLRVP